MDAAEAKSHVDTLCLTRTMLDTIRGFSPEFYDSMFDLCLLSASRYGITKMVFHPLHTHTVSRPRLVTKIDQFCIGLREQLMSQHKQFMTDNILGLKEEDCADAPLHLAGKYIGTEVSEQSIRPQGTSNAQSPSSKLVDCELLMCSLGMFKQNLPSPDESSSWKSGCLCVAKNLDVWYIVNKMDNLIESTPMCIGTLIINQEDFQKTCEIWKFDKLCTGPLVTKGRIQRCGLVKKRGQINTSYQERFFVLNHDVLEYYDDCSVYLQSQMERVGSKSKGSSKFKGTLSTRHLEVSPGRQNGVNQSRDGYHFTIENKFDAKIIECACSDKETRDKWVQKIREASAAVLQEVAYCLFKRCISYVLYQALT